MNEIRKILLLLFISINGIVLAQNRIELSKILKQLNLSEKQCKLNLVVSKPFPKIENETIVVIPEIAKEEEGLFELHSHILIVDTTTSKIKYRYFQSSKTNGWVSDAVLLAEIKIDTAPYKIAKNKRAFGIRVYFYNNSKPNPYSKESISLFTKEKDVLKNVLNNYMTMEYVGEWDTTCYGEFLKEEKVFIITNTITKGNFNILVNNKITETKNEYDKKGECVYKDKVSFHKTTLKFNGSNYQH